MFSNVTLLYSQGTYESYAYCAYELVQLNAATSQEEQKNLFHYSFSTPSAWLPNLSSQTTENAEPMPAPSPFWGEGELSSKKPLPARWVGMGAVLISPHSRWATATTVALGHFSVTHTELCPTVTLSHTRTPIRPPIMYDQKVWATCDLSTTSKFSEYYLSFKVRTLLASSNVLVSATSPATTMSCGETWRSATPTSRKET